MSRCAFNIFNVRSVHVRICRFEYSPVFNLAVPTMQPKPNLSVGHRVSLLTKPVKITFAWAAKHIEHLVHAPNCMSRTGVSIARAQNIHSPVQTLVEFGPTSPESINTPRGGFGKTRGWGLPVFVTNQPIPSLTTLLIRYFNNNVLSERVGWYQWSSTIGSFYIIHLF